MLQQNHLQEWLDSGVHPDIIALNVRSLDGTAAYDYLLYSDRLKRRNDGRLTDGELRKYRHLESGGWWVAGIDPLTDGELMLWGCFKPDSPRVSFEKQKPIKYEHPPGEPTRAFLLQIPDHIWEEFSARYGIPITDADHQRGFWQWVWRHGLPIKLVEGVKKAACLLSNNIVAIGLPSHTGAFRSIKNETGICIGHRLIDDINLFATPGREITICFDQDEKPKTVRAVNKSRETTGYLLSQFKCEVKIAGWEESEKGIDDFFMAHGREALDEIFELALPLEEWRTKQSFKLTYTPDWTSNSRYVGDIPIPDSAKLVCIKAPKGCGKTETISKEVARAIESGRPIIVLTHRVQLGEALCERFGIPYVSQIRDSEFGRTLGYGLCVDSLHPNSQARFDASGWRDCVVIIDECEQVIWHLLHSATCQKQRVVILKNLKELLTNVLLSPHGKIMLSDADLSDLSIDFIKKFAGVPVHPWIYENSYNSEQRCKAFVYGGTDPTALLAALEQHIDEGGKPLISTSSQKVKSKWSTRNIEVRLQGKYPELKILRIDAESVSDPTHPAFGCIANLNEILTEYDIVIHSPSIETGVSIDIKGHFTSAWGIQQGVAPVQSELQALARLRDPVNRYVWAKEHGLGKIGNGSLSYKSILAAQDKSTKNIKRLLQDADIQNIDCDFSQTALTTWARMAARINSGMVNHRDNIVSALRSEGYEVEVLNPEETPELDALKKEVIACRDKNHRIECEVIAASEEITSSEYQKLKDKKAKTADERHQERKHNIGLLYPDVPLTPELIKKDDDGWYPKLQLHFFQTLGRMYLRDRDVRKAKELTKESYPKGWKPDFNKVPQVEKQALLDTLNIRQFFDSDTEYSSAHSAVVELAEKCQELAWDIKRILGISVSPKDTPIAILQRLLGRMGLSLKGVGRRGTRKDPRQRLYKFVAPADGREEIFAGWLRREEALAEASKLEAIAAEARAVFPDESATPPCPPQVNIYRELPPGHNPPGHNPQRLGGERDFIPCPPPIKIGDRVRHWMHGAKEFLIMGMDWAGVKLQSLATGANLDAFYSEVSPA